MNLRCTTNQYVMLSAIDCCFTVMPFCVRLCTTNPCCHELHTCAAKNKRPLNKAVANVSAVPQRGTAVCCNALQHTTHCNTYEAPHKRHATHKVPDTTHMKRPHRHGSTLQHTATHIKRLVDAEANVTLQHTATHCNTLQHI